MVKRQHGQTIMRLDLAAMMCSRVRFYIKVLVLANKMATNTESYYGEKGQVCSFLYASIIDPKLNPTVTRII